MGPPERTIEDPVLTRWIFDTGVWLHYGSVEAVRLAADAARRGPSAEILAAPVSLAEAASVLVRRGQAARVERVIASIRETSRLIEAGPDEWVACGRIHAAERARHPDLSLADALILAVARSEKARLLTTDRVLAKNGSGVPTKFVAVPRSS